MDGSLTWDDVGHELLGTLQRTGLLHDSYRTINQEESLDRILSAMNEDLSRSPCFRVSRRCKH